VRVWLAVNTLNYPVNGYFAELLNWALGLRSVGCDLVWLDGWDPKWGKKKALERATRVHGLIEAHGLGEAFALAPSLPDLWLAELSFVPFGIDDASDGDVLLSFDKQLPGDVVRRFRRSALIDYDPGITQGWIRYGSYDFSAYDVHFTTGKGVPAFDAGFHWRHVPPCVALDYWPVAPPGPDASFTTVSHWRQGGKWYFNGVELVPNDKRTGFLPFLDLPKYTSVPLELAIPMSMEEETDEYRDLEERGWKLRDSVALSELDVFHDYVQSSLGMFSCVKPAYMFLETGFVHGLTPCFLASGKPAVVQDTGPSGVLADDGGLFRFRTIDDAVRYLEAAVENYDENCRAARVLAEEHFDARKVAARILEETVP
jgi:hypothetical protein